MGTFKAVCPNLGRKLTSRKTNMLSHNFSKKKKFCKGCEITRQAAAEEQRFSTNQADWMLNACEENERKSQAGKTYKYYFLGRELHCDLPTEHS